MLRLNQLSVGDCKTVQFLAYKYGLRYYTIYIHTKHINFKMFPSLTLYQFCRMGSNINGVCFLALASCFHTAKPQPQHIPRAKQRYQTRQLAIICRIL